MTIKYSICKRCTTYKYCYILVLVFLKVYTAVKLKVYFDGGCKHLEQNLSGGGCIGYKYDNNNENNMIQIFQCQYYYGKETHYNSHIIEYLSLINSIQSIKYYLTIDDIDDIDLLGDSAIVINHIKNKYNKKKDFYLQQYHSLASSLLDSINTKIELIHIPRENNKIADEIANIAMNQLESKSSLSNIYEGSFFIMKANSINEQFRSIYANMELEIDICGIKSTIIPNNVDIDNLRVLDVINDVQNCSMINIKSNNESIDVPLYSLNSIIEFPININTKHYGQVPSINILMLHVSFKSNESILKAVINLISSPGIYSEQSFTYIFSCLLHSIQRRNLLSILNTKVLIKISNNNNNRKFCSFIDENSNNQLNSNYKIYLASPLQVSLLLGNMKSTELLLSIVGKNLLQQECINNESENIHCVMTDEEAAELGMNIRNKKLMKEFMKTIK